MLSTSQENQLMYLRKIMERDPGYSITQHISHAVRFAKGDRVPFSTADMERCLRIYAEKK